MSAFVRAKSFRKKWNCLDNLISLHYWRVLLLTRLSRIYLYTLIIVCLNRIHFHLCFSSTWIYFYLYAFVWMLNIKSIDNLFIKNIVTWIIFDRIMNTNIYRHNNITEKVVSFKMICFLTLACQTVLLKREFKPCERQIF